MNQSASTLELKISSHANRFPKKNRVFSELSANELPNNPHTSNYETRSPNVIDFTRSSSYTSRQEKRDANAPSYPVDAAHVFDELDRVRADDRPFLKVVGDLRNAPTIPERDALADRLEGLLQAYLEDYGQALDAESLRTFMAFVSHHPELKRPVITATPDGNLFAEWKGDKGRRYLGVQFLPTRQVRYVAIRPNPRHAPYRIRSSGLVTVDQLLAEITSYDVTDWAGRSK